MESNANESQESDGKYQDAVNHLDAVINEERLNESLTIQFKQAITELNGLGFDISTNFLRNLDRIGDKTRVTTRIYTLLNGTAQDRKHGTAIKIKTNEQEKYFKTYSLNGTIYAKKQYHFITF